MYPWREMYYTFIFSSALLFSLTSLLFTRCSFLCQDPIQVTTLPLVVMSPYFHLGYDRFSHFSCFWCPWKFWGVQFVYFAEYLSIRSDLSSHGQRKEGEEDHRNKQSFWSYQRYILSMWFICTNISLDHLDDVEIVRFLQGKVTLLLRVFTLCSLERSCYEYPAFKEFYSRGFPCGRVVKNLPAIQGCGFDLWLGS